MHKTNTDINTIGGIPDFDMIYDVLRMLTADVSASQIQKAVITDNRYGIRTEEARGRFLRAIKSALVGMIYENILKFTNGLSSHNL